MISPTKLLPCLAVAGFAFAAGFTPAAPVLAQAQTAAEKLYAELHKLPVAEKKKKILEGATKEGQFDFIMTMSGRNGREVTQAFEKEFGTYLKVNESQMGSQDGGARLVAEESIGRHLTDLVLLAVPDMTQLLQKGIPASYHSSNLDKVLPQYKGLVDPDGRWTPLLWSDHGIVYNSNVLSAQDAPKGWMDACNPALKGKASYDPAENRLLSGIWNMYNKDWGELEKWVKCMGENDPIIQRGHTLRMNLMLAGDHAASFDQYFHEGATAWKKNPKVPFKAVLDAPIMAYATGTTINKNTPRPYAAALFSDFVLTEAPQKYIVGINRGAVTLPHQFIPASANLVIYGYDDPASEARFQDLWSKYVGRKR